jgi:chorismate synthase
MADTLGKFFTVTSFGESHGPVVGIVVDGCPAGLPLNEADLQPDMERRRPGQSEFVTPRQEVDRAEIISGVFNGRTTGAPLCMLVRNQDVDSCKYESLQYILRPGHADYTSRKKYGNYGDYRGGGRFSGRITAGFVLAGSVARKLLAGIGIEIVAYTVEIGNIQSQRPDSGYVKNLATRNSVFCPDPAAAEKMAKAILAAKQVGDSLGGVVEVAASSVPPGWGEPVAETLDGELAKAFFAIPGVKGVEFGAGFAAARLPGSENNDPFIIENGQLRTKTNNAGGILGGISTGMPIVARVVIKPTPSISRPQETVDMETMTGAILRVEGRHDPCIVPRAVVVVEAMTAITLCDFALRAGAIPRIFNENR